MPAASVATLSQSNPHIIKSTSSVNFFAAEIVLKVDGFNAVSYTHLTLPTKRIV